MKKNTKEIYNEIDRANDALNDGGKFNGMSYEEGVKMALEWVLGEADKPMDE